MNNEQTKPIKPMCLKLAEFETALAELINGTDIPFYLLEKPLHSVANAATELANAERKAAQEKYEKELEEYEKSEGETK
jgi:hypothetical protein